MLKKLSGAGLGRIFILNLKYAFLYIIIESFIQMIKIQNANRKFDSKVQFTQKVKS